jgi:hypothetical protein
MGVTFLHVSDIFKDDLEALSMLADLVKDKGLRDKDDFWEKLILDYIISLYNDISLKEKQYLQTCNEKAIKEFIRKKLELNDNFTEKHLLTVELEPQNKHARQLGFYDIKIRSSLWNSYFSFECKCLDNTRASILEYVYNPNKMKDKVKFEDGGVYRFLINKYSTNKKFGGMIGLLQEGNLSAIKNLIYTYLRDIKLTSNSKSFGVLTENGISEYDILYYFQSNHSRFDIAENKECEPVRIHHCIYDFTK